MGERSGRGKQKNTNRGLMDRRLREGVEYRSRGRWGRGEQKGKWLDN